MSLSEDWIKAGTEEYHYNLGGLSVSAAVGILKKLGKTAAISTLEKVLGAAGALAGAYVLDGVSAMLERHGTEILIDLDAQK